jgi:tetratricopeptide (TPR) repeat protein
VLLALQEAKGSIFDNIFGHSWDLMLPDAKYVLMVMPLFATSASRKGIEAASGLHHSALDEALGQLVGMSLVDASGELELARQRYSIHPLTRAFATSKLQQETELYYTALKQLAEFMQTFVAEHGGFWYRDGFAQLETERLNILATIQKCWKQGLAETGMAILHDALGFLVIRGYWNDVVELTQRAAELAKARDDEVGAALWQAYGISWVSRHRGDLDAAERIDREALEVFEKHGTPEPLFYAKRSLGRVAQERGQFEQAEVLFREVLEYYESTGDERDVLFVTSSIAQTALQRGDLDRAQSVSERALRSAYDLGALERIAGLRNILGGVAFQRGDLEQAQRHWEEALAYYERIERLDEHAGVLLALARVELIGGRTNNAKKMLLGALDGYRRLGVEPKAQEIESLLANPAESMHHEEHSS